MCLTTEWWWKWRNFKKKSGKNWNYFLHKLWANYIDGETLYYYAARFCRAGPCAGPEEQDIGTNECHFSLFLDLFVLFNLFSLLLIDNVQNLSIIAEVFHKLMSKYVQWICPLHLALYFVYLYWMIYLFYLSCILSIWWDMWYIVFI